MLGNHLGPENDAVKRKEFEPDTRNGMSLKEFNHWMESPIEMKCREPGDPMNNHPVILGRNTGANDPSPPLRNLRMENVDRTNRHYYRIDGNGIVTFFEDSKKVLETGVRMNSFYLAVRKGLPYKKCYWYVLPTGAVTLSDIDADVLKHQINFAKEYLKRFIKAPE